MVKPRPKRNAVFRGRRPDSVLKRAGYTNKLAAKLTKDALLRNLDIAEKLGCLDEAGLAEMRKGKAATVRKGPYTGDQLSVDHIIPRVVCPELDTVIANLELLPLRMNESKNAKIGSRQKSLAKQLNQAGLLSTSGFHETERRQTRPPDGIRGFTRHPAGQPNPTFELPKMSFLPPRKLFSRVFV